MKIISHRGNLNGPNSCAENHPDSIREAISKEFDVEIDLWKISDSFLLGHDEPEYEIKKDFFLEYSKMLWIHCKNLESLNYLSENKEELNFFWHQTDDYTLVSNKIIWTYPKKRILNNSIIVDLDPPSTDRIYAYKDIYGVCTDYAEETKSILSHL